MSAKVLHEQLLETGFQQQVEALADRAGWWCWHDNNSRRNKAGLPDLILIRPPRVVFAEVKREKGRVRVSQVAQRKVLAMLARCPGVEVYLWKPSDWDAPTGPKAVLTRRDPPTTRRE